MRAFVLLGLLFLLLSAVCSTFAVAVSKNNATLSAQNYTVLVGGNDSAYNAEFQGFFPANITIRAGDTVTWKLNTGDIHTVTFAPGMSKAPDFLLPVPGDKVGLMMNPLAAFPAAPANGEYNGSTYANSAVMGPDEGQPKSFSLTFTEPGVYSYVCIVHSNESMKGTVIVENASATVPSPPEAAAEGKKELDALRSKTKLVHSAAVASIKGDETNPDNTTHYVTVGFGQGQIQLEAFFPSRLNVKSGDTVVFALGKEDMEPHTVTFLNGAAEPELFLPKPQPQGPPLIVLNPEVLLPRNESSYLTDQGVFSSGFMDPGSQGEHTFKLRVGNASGILSFLCLLHDETNMKGSLDVSAPIRAGSHR